MRAIPEPFAAPPRGVTPWGLLRWLVARQWTTVVQGTVCDVIWLLGLALTPWAIGRAVDEGLVAGDYGAFLRWLGIVVLLQLQHSLIQGLRDRAGSVNFERSWSRVDQIIARASSRVTVAAERDLHPGAVVTMASSDVWALSFVAINVGSLVSALISFATVAVILLRDSLLLGGLVIVGVPAFSALLFLLVRSLRTRQTQARDATSEMNTVATDSARGLRVLRGIGGEEWFLARFRERSAAARDAGKKVARPMSIAESLKVLIAGTLVVGLTWIGALLVTQGELTVGELVSFYGYAGFMVLPVTLLNQAVTVAVRALIAARQITRLLEVAPLWPREVDGRAPGVAEALKAAQTAEHHGGGADPALDWELFDERSRLRVRAGELLGVAVGDSAQARALVDRIGRLAPDDPEAVVRLQGANMAELPIDVVRDRIVVSDPVPFLFSGTLRELLDPRGRRDDETILRAVAAVDAIDIVESVDGRLDAVVGERGVEFSGGQRQRLGAARSLLCEPQLLVLHEPTSSVDASTEERIAAGLRDYRRGRTTMIVSTSPLVLGVSDRVALIDGAGRLVADGAHEELLQLEADYRGVVLRAEETS
ncbi:ABC transporter ATP-binding protein [Agromyces laixinhei]|uniref:ABC transporter ATP-binding protein n=1 Tax=Agromyces laixinhei TaxID=2585717 RepID=UPI0012ED0C81|nr:ABC transporter ATP-binding protein [Agromyces laixinhei]